ncbi:hypothetical protein G6O67_006846 [Ophiocordyceps sinensis]|uniref:TM7S3/TM198-like domain-containing protein n=1 Tax=Ophiocordyceps sinensis TaxID=72228 RepID=A0A8H4PN56_9HYPO|nr:hypothetical protein G6O67_006846 [Ophiocordyceps sinensis]
MLPRTPRLWALFLLALALQLAVAHSFNQLDTRQDGDSGSRIRPAPEASPEPNDSDFRNRDGDFTNGASPSTTEAPRRTASITSKRSSDSPSSTSPGTAASATGDPGNPMFVNATISAGQLPLAPEITPGWGVSGVIMLLTGLTYTLVGIKNRWIHTFFSTAYMTALGVAVLIVYVMTVPVSNAVQGGYVVAVVMSGCAVGVASMFFKELTEGLGCALGGFSVSMWLLCLVPGGLLRPVPSKAIFISSFTLVGFAFYFSRWTRDWALIITIAFSGATVTVLGLDCFTRAGLKEFWAYIWDVNGNLFPLGADTYPVTKGIRVESAAIVIIFLMGIISQIKLWRIVREKREKRAVERAEGQRNLELEEENVGRQIEEVNARERRQWERVYGHGLSGSGTDSRMSDLGDVGSEKKLRDSHTASYKLRSSVEAMDTAMSESDQSRCGHNPLMAAEDTRDGKVTVRVGVDDVPDTPTDVGEYLDEKGQSMAERQAVTTPSYHHSQRTATSKRVSQAQTVTEAPEVVPLPFCVPAHEESRLEDDRSSIATFAADDAERYPAESPAEPPQRRSLAKRLSRGSLSLLRSISQMSGREDPAHDSGESMQELVVSKSHRLDDDNESLAATIDGESVSGDDARSVPSMNARRSIEIHAELSDGLEQPGEGDAHKPRSMSPTGPPRNETPAALDGKLVAALPDTDSGSAEQPSRDAAEGPDAAVPQDKAKSTTSASSTPASLTKDRLPCSLSRVAMSYRTNEWAKHLGYADTPDLDELRVTEPARPVKADKERSVPVNVTELQKRADEGTPEPVMIRSDSRASNVSYVPSVSRHTPRRERPSSMVAQERDSAARSQGTTPVVAGSMGLVRSTSSSTQIRKSSSGFKPAVAAAAVAEPIPEERPAAGHVASLSGNEMFPRSPPPVVPGVVSYNSPQTLIGQRDMFLRSKSQGNLIGSAQEPGLGPASDAASVYSSSMYAADPDDIPLSQRKQIMRQSSLMSLVQPSASQVRMSSAGFESNDNLPFNSHQPRRVSALPAQNVRDAQLANFRQSVQQDLRSGTPVMSSSGRETPFAPASLLANREADVQRNIEMQRNVLMGQKEAEAQRKESQRREKEFADRAFDERMRTGDLLEAHRDAMRKMQKGAGER